MARRLPKTTISLTPQQLENLAELQSYTGSERSELIRAAIEDYTQKSLPVYRKSRLERILLAKEESRNARPQNTDEPLMSG